MSVRVAPDSPVARVDAVDAECVADAAGRVVFAEVPVAQADPVDPAAQRCKITAQIIYKAVPARRVDQDLAGPVAPAHAVDAGCAVVRVDPVARVGVALAPVPVAQARAVRRSLSVTEAQPVPTLAARKAAPEVPADRVAEVDAEAVAGAEDLAVRAAGHPRRAMRHPRQPTPRSVREPTKFVQG